MTDDDVRSGVELRGDELRSVPVDALAGVVVLVAAVVTALAVISVFSGLVVGIVVAVIWLVNQSWGLLALGVPALLVTTYLVWQGSFYAAVVSLEALGVRVQGGPVKVCMVLAPALAAVIGPLAGLRLLGRGAAMRPLLALIGASMLIALGVAIGRALP